MLGGGNFEVMVTDNVVPIENRPSFVSGDHHRHSFGHT